LAFCCLNVNNQKDPLFLHYWCNLYPSSQSLIGGDDNKELPMQCFIPFSEEVLEQHPELLASGLVPFREEYLHYTMEYLVVSPDQAENLATTGFSLKENANQKVKAI